MSSAVAQPRVLIVDDNHLIRRLLAMIVEGSGFVAIEAESGEAALELLREVPVQLCIVDEVMPGMAGSELIRGLRASGDRNLAGMPVVGVSGRPGAFRALLDAGADAFVPKPIEERPILSAMTRALSAHRAEPPGRSAV